MEKNDVKNERMAAAQANSVNQTYVNPTPGEITIVGLGTLKTGRKGFSIKSEPYISDKAAQLLAEIGCNASQAQVDIINNGPEFNGFKKSLESCAKAGN